jgi:hypothetical protein
MIGLLQPFGGIKAVCTWNPAENGECPSRPLDCMMYPLSIAAILADDGNLNIEFWVCTKCPIYKHEPLTITDLAIKWANIIKSWEQKNLLDTWYRKVTPTMVGYRPHCTVKWVDDAWVVYPIFAQTYFKE